MIAEKMMLLIVIESQVFGAKGRLGKIRHSGWIIWKDHIVDGGSWEIPELIDNARVPCSGLVVRLI